MAWDPYHLWLTVRLWSWPWLSIFLVDKWARNECWWGWVVAGPIV